MLIIQLYITILLFISYYGIWTDNNNKPEIVSIYFIQTHLFFIFTVDTYYLLFKILFGFYSNCH